MSWPARDQVGSLVSQGQYKTLPSFTTYLLFTHRVPRNQEGPFKKCRINIGGFTELPSTSQQKQPKTRKGTDQRNMLPCPNNCDRNTRIYFHTCESCRGTGFTGPRPQPCPSCNGFRIEAFDNGDVRRCSGCNGSGSILQIVQCMNCGGQGRLTMRCFLPH